VCIDDWGVDICSQRHAEVHRSASGLAPLHFCPRAIEGSGAKAKVANWYLDLCCWATTGLATASITHRPISMIYSLREALPVSKRVSKIAGRGSQGSEGLPRGLDASV